MYIRYGDDEMVREIQCSGVALGLFCVEFCHMSLAVHAGHAPTTLSWHWSTFVVYLAYYHTMVGSHSLCRSNISISMLYSDIEHSYCNMLYVRANLCMCA